MLSARITGSILACVLAFGAACGSAEIRDDGFGDADGGGGTLVPGPGPGADGGPGLDQNPDSGPAPSNERCQKMDILFIVDDSASMQEEQSNLADNFPSFVEALNDFTTESGSQLDWRIAVTTTGKTAKVTTVTPAIGPFPEQRITTNEQGYDGKFRQEGCNTSRRWIERNDPSAVSDFECLADVGTNGPSTEMPLEAMKLAFTARMDDGINAGFLRPDALLAVVILTDEDDASNPAPEFELRIDSYEGAPVADYAAAMTTVARGDGRWATAVIAGETTCESAFGKAVKADRLKEFVGLAGARGKFSSICSGNLTTSLAEALATFDAACTDFPPPTVN